MSIALGRKADSLDLSERYPFDVQICRVPAGKTRCPYHLHTSQFELFQVLSGSGTIRHKDGLTQIEVGGTFQFGPGEPHQLISAIAEELIALIVADNPLGEACYYPDSKKWAINAPGGGILKGIQADYFDGEE